MRTFLLIASLLLILLTGTATTRTTQTNPIIVDKLVIVPPSHMPGQIYAEVRNGGSQAVEIFTVTAYGALPGREPERLLIDLVHKPLPILLPGTTVPLILTGPKFADGSKLPRNATVKLQFDYGPPSSTASLRIVQTKRFGEYNPYYESQGCCKDSLGNCIGIPTPTPEPTTNGLMLQRDWRDWCTHTWVPSQRTCTDDVVQARVRNVGTERPNYPEVVGIMRHAVYRDYYLYRACQLSRLKPGEESECEILLRWCDNPTHVLHSIYVGEGATPPTPTPTPERG